jgi:hypothetical protein
MILKEIIENDSDRLFIVDNECYIVFTGDTLEDDKPFIRIGNWLDLYVEIIPLIENIIITDTLSGNPLHEQFNIDIKNLQHNRYIGSQHTLERFLDFQRLCGLDLKNASIISIEKDIPEITGKRLISKKNQFIGVFYRDSNFKVIYNKNDIISLSDAEKISYSHNNILERISSANRGKRYRGTGICFGRNIPFVFNNGRISSIGYPDNFFSWLVEHEIDPGSLENIVLPLENPQSLIDLLKWGQSRESGINLYTDLLDEADFLKKLFGKSLKKIGSYSSLDTTLDECIEIVNFNGSGNMVINYSLTRPEPDTVKIGYLSAVEDIDEFIRSSGDAIILNYSLFEKNTMRFKSTNTQVIVIDDGNPNISRLVSPDNVIVYQNTEYTIVKILDPENILSRNAVEEELLGEILNGNIGGVGEIIKKIDLIEDPLEKNIRLINLSTLIKFILNSTADRKLSSRLKGLYTSLQGKIRRDIIKENSSRLRGSLIFHNNSVYQFIDVEKETGNREILVRMIREADEYMPIPPPAQDKAYGDDTDLFNRRIRHDRERLRRLLDYFIDKSEMFSEKKEYIEELDQLLKKRREDYLVEKKEGKGYEVSIQLEDSGERAGNKSIKAKKPGKGKEQDSVFVSKSFRVTAAAAILLLLVFAALFLSGTFTVFNKEEEKFQETPYEKTLREIYTIEKETLPLLQKKFKIRVKVSDILRYANSVAVKNNYNKISLSALREKNPDWIYPGNVFLMLDGTRIKVKRGDTLWKLSEEKIIESIIVFNRIIEKIDQSDPDISEKLLAEAKKVAFIEKHLKMLDRIIRTREESRAGSMKAE